MKKRIYVVLFILLFAVALTFAILNYSPDPDFLALNLNSSFLLFGFAKVTGAFTGIKGKVGNVCYSMWKGVQCLKTRATPANPQSTDQTTNRTLFTDLVACFKSILSELVHRFWNPFSVGKQTGWGNLIGANQLELSGSAIEYPDLIITKGSLPGESIIDPTYDDSSGKVEATWVDSGAEGSSASDLALLIAYHQPTNTWYFSSAAATRGDESDEVTLPVSLTPSSVYAFLFFFTEETVGGVISSVSNSNGSVCVAPTP